MPHVPGTVLGAGMQQFPDMGGRKQTQTPALVDLDSSRKTNKKPKKYR